MNIMEFIPYCATHQKEMQQGEFTDRLMLGALVIVLAAAILMAPAAQQEAPEVVINQEVIVSEPEPAPVDMPVPPVASQLPDFASYADVRQKKQDCRASKWKASCDVMEIV